MTIHRALLSLMLLIALGQAASAQQLVCHREGTAVSCDDGRRGAWTGNSIVWADGSQSRMASSHPSVIIGNKSSVTVGPGVFVGQGKGMVPLEDPNKTPCVMLDGVSYCQ